LPCSAESSSRMDSKSSRLAGTFAGGSAEIEPPVWWLLLCSAGEFVANRIQNRRVSLGRVASQGGPKREDCVFGERGRGTEPRGAAALALHRTASDDGSDAKIGCGSCPRFGLVRNRWAARHGQSSVRNRQSQRPRTRKPRCRIKAEPGGPENNVGQAWPQLEPCVIVEATASRVTDSAPVSVWPHPKTPAPAACCSREPVAAASLPERTGPRSSAVGGTPGAGRREIVRRRVRARYVGQRETCLGFGGAQELPARHSVDAAATNARGH